MASSIGIRVFGRLLALALAVMPAASLADVPDPPEVAYPTLPAHAVAAAGFVPAGWAIETKLSGDLNGDGVADLVLVLHDHDKANVLANPDGPGEKTIDTNPRILVVALGQKGGGFDLAVQNHMLIPRHIDPDVEDYLDKVTIQRGAIHVEMHVFMSAGGWGAGNTSYVLRYQSGRLEMIGYDSQSVQRNTGETNDVSINYATGKVKLTTGTIDDSKPTKVTWRAVPAGKRPSIDEIGDGIDFDPGVAPR